MLSTMMTLTSGSRRLKMRRIYSHSRSLTSYSCRRCNWLLFILLICTSHRGPLDISAQSYTRLFCNSSCRLAILFFWLSSNFFTSRRTPILITNYWMHLAF